MSRDCITPNTLGRELSKRGGGGGGDGQTLLGGARYFKFPVRVIQNNSLPSFAYSLICQVIVVFTR